MLFCDLGHVFGATFYTVVKSRHHLSYFLHSTRLTATWQASSQLFHPSSSLLYFSANSTVVLGFTTLRLPIGSRINAFLGSSCHWASFVKSSEYILSENSLQKDHK